MKGHIDTNLLIYGSNRTAPEFTAGAAFMDKVFLGPAIYTVSWINIAEYLSFTTLPLTGGRALLSSGEAMKNVEIFIGSPYVKILTEGDAHWDHLSEIVRQLGNVKGPFFHDCRIAAIMMENGVDTIFTRDSEFRRIPGIKVVDPIAANVTS